MASADPSEYPHVAHSSAECLSRSASLSLFRDIPDEAIRAAAEAAYEPQYDAVNLDVPIVIVSSEISPWSKTGGLALVCASYGIEFAKRGHRTMCVSPMYDDFKDTHYQTTRSFHLFGVDTEVRYFHQWHEISPASGTTPAKGCDYVFIDHPCFRRAGGLYHNLELGVEYDDNLYRFALFCLAALEAPCAIAPGGVAYGERVVFIANDWQSALLPVYLTHSMRPAGRFTNSRCLFVVHNFGYQGIYPMQKLVPSSQGPLPIIVPNVSVADLGLDGTPAGEHLFFNYPPDMRSYEGDDGNVLNLTKGGVLTCDRILTVSPGYADEMKTLEGGFSLDTLVRQKEFFMAGILNGIEVASWDPTTDPHIAVNYGVGDFREGKALCKAQLQEKIGLAVNPDVPLIAFIGRLTAQKGIDLILEAMDWLCTDTGDNIVTGRVQVMLMGNGDENYARALREIGARFPGKVAGVNFQPIFEHLAYAGSDFLLMPSRYEPCGLPQMCAQRYGSIPIVTLCGGLKDSVAIEPRDEATGFGILPLDIHKLKETVYLACETYFTDPEHFATMQRRGMVADFSWIKAIDTYEKNIDWALADPPYVR